ncbi:MAG: hypothetical protein NW220_12835 [Leptolyngbyaceae cyanobacterium bins.349]|nr:hypothetical protein [Leptolyngbyaceae cyanobacterium bins.349]
MNQHAIKLSSTGWFGWLARKIHNSYRPKKTHDYSHLVFGVDYVFEHLNELANQGYMTAQKKGVKPGDYVILKQNDTLQKYCIQEINYYSSPNDMWIALLLKVELSGV